MLQGNKDWRSVYLSTYLIGENMPRKTHDKRWRKWSKKNKLPRPSQEEIDMSWDCIGILGRCSHPDMFDDNLNNATREVLKKI